LLAAQEGYPEIAAALLQAGADPNLSARDDKGWTPLLHASAAGHGDIVQLLLQRGADPNARTSDGLSAATLATAHGHPEIVHMLFDNQR